MSGEMFLQNLTEPPVRRKYGNWKVEFEIYQMSNDIVK